MNQDSSEQLPAIESWDSYWQGAQSSGAYTGGGSEHPLVLSFWTDYFAEAWERKEQPRIIDIASGNGAVVEHARNVFGGVLPGFTCLDISESAVKILEERFPGIRGVVSDAANIFLEPGSFDIVTSQFGVEYAGLDAVESLERLVAPKGELALLLHTRDGVIFRQCTDNLAAVRAMQEAEFTSRCSAMFEAGFALMKGGDPEPFQVAGRALAPAIKAMEDIMKRYGQHVASGSVLQIYRDVRTIHKRMKHYDCAEVLEWLQKMEHELVAYEGRMASMRSVALDEADFEQVRAALTAKGLTILRAEPLRQSERDLPVAWALIARRE